MKKETVKKFFEFLDKKENKRSIEAVFLLFPETIPEGFIVERSLDLTGIPIQSLPKGLKVGGYLDLSDTSIQSLPEGLEVEGFLDLSNTPIQSLPEGLKVGRSLFLSYSFIQSLPEGLKVRGSLYLDDTPLSRKYTQGEIQRMIESTRSFVGERLYL